MIRFYLGLIKAFDCLSHNPILTKLENLGFQGTAWEWFKSYLTGSHQLVELKQNLNGTITSFRSKLHPVTRGVPQGSTGACHPSFFSYNVR